MEGALYFYILYAGKQVHVAQLRVGEMVCLDDVNRTHNPSLEVRYSASRTFLSGLLPHFECLSTDISSQFRPIFSNGTGRDVLSLSPPVPSRVLVTPVRNVCILNVEEGECE